MTQRIAAATVIRGKGACSVFVNGIADEEVEKNNELHAKELETVMNELKAVKKRMNNVPADICRAERLARNLAGLRLDAAKPRGIFRRIREGIGFIWACVWCYGLKFGLWEYVGDEEDEE